MNEAFLHDSDNHAKGAHSHWLFTLEMFSGQVTVLKDLHRLTSLFIPLILFMP
jgi:hypothetical protein